jgi:hypothetical protein
MERKIWERKVVRKLDLHIMPWILISALFWLHYITELTCGRLPLELSVRDVAYGRTTN